MKLFLVFTSLIIMSLTQLIYIADMNRYSEALAYVSNIALESINSSLHTSDSASLSTQNQNLFTQNIEKNYLKSLPHSSDPYLKNSTLSVSKSGDVLNIKIYTQDFQRLPFLRLDSITISMTIPDY